MKKEIEVLNLIKEIDLEAVSSALEIISRRCVSCKGEWKYRRHYGERYRMCPFCGSEKKDDLSAGWNFCPVCGAYLEKEEER